MDDKDVDNIMEELEGNDDLLSKDITQLDKVEPVTKALSSMGIFWKKITTKLSDDSICYMCKKSLDDKEKFGIISVPNDKVDKGLIAFVAVCNTCNTDDDTE